MLPLLLFLGLVAFFTYVLTRQGRQRKRDIQKMDEPREARVLDLRDLKYDPLKPDEDVCGAWREPGKVIDIGKARKS